MPNDAEARRDEFELLGDVFADRLQGAAAVRAITGRCGIGDGVARQMVRQRLASTFGPCSFDCFCGRRRIFGFIGLEFLELQFELRDLLVESALGISKGAVTKYVGLAAAAGLDWAGVKDTDEAALERCLLVALERPRDHVQPDYGRLHQELRRKGMTLMLLWEEHRADHADRHTYAYSQFCENYRRFARQLKRSMRQIHRAGEKLFIDYAGPTIGLTDGSRAHIFVAALGASSYTYACATPR